MTWDADRVVPDLPIPPDECAGLWALVVEQVDAEATEDERPYLAEWRKAAETQV